MGEMSMCVSLQNAGVDISLLFTFLFKTAVSIGGAALLGYQPCLTLNPEPVQQEPATMQHVNGVCVTLNTGVRVTTTATGSQFTRVMSCFWHL